MTPLSVLVREYFRELHFFAHILFLFLFLKFDVHNFFMYILGMHFVIMCLLFDNIRMLLVALPYIRSMKDIKHHFKEGFK